MDNSNIVDVDVNKKIGQETTKNGENLSNKCDSAKRGKSEAVADVWQYFEHEKENVTAACKICKAVLKAAGGSTSGLINHAKSKHQIDVLKRKVCTGWFPF